MNDFLSTLQDAGELRRISAPVDAGLEVAAITDRVCKTPGGGPALLFEKPRNSSIPIVTNLLGSYRRLCLALGVEELYQIGDKLNRLLQPEPGGWLETLRLTAPPSGMAKFAPRVIKTAVCQQVVRLGRDVNLWDLPILRCWPDEANPVITSGQVITHDPITKTRGVARFPVQVINQQQLVPHWHRYHAGFQHLQIAIHEQRQLPVAISLGGDPSIGLLASGQLGVTDPYWFGGGLRGAGIDLVKARTLELDVPAASEIVLEGHIDYAAPLIEAPSIASGSGHYLPSEPLPIIQVTAMTHRANPVFPSIVPGPPPSEESWIALAVERMSLVVARSTIPEIVDIHQPFAGAARNLIFVSIRKEHPFQARQVLNALWGSRLLGLNKIAIIVDADVDVQREHEVWLAVGSHVNPGRDVIINEGPTQMDDQTTERRGLGHKMGIDATRKYSEETFGQKCLKPLKVPNDLATRLNERWTELGLPQ